MLLSLKEVDQRVNKAILKDSLESFNEKAMPEIHIERASPEQVEALSQEYKADATDSLKLGGQDPYSVFKRANLKLSRLICNKAHQMQDLASAWI